MIERHRTECAVLLDIISLLYWEGLSLSRWRVPQQRLLSLFVVRSIPDCYEKKRCRTVCVRFDLLSQEVIEKQSFHADVPHSYCFPYSKMGANELLVAHRQACGCEEKMYRKWL